MSFHRRTATQKHLHPARNSPGCLDISKLLNSSSLRHFARPRHTRCLRNPQRDIPGRARLLERCAAVLRVCEVPRDLAGRVDRNEGGDDRVGHLDLREHVRAAVRDAVPNGVAEPAKVRVCAIEQALHGVRRLAVHRTEELLAALLVVGDGLCAVPAVPGLRDWERERGSGVVLTEGPPWPGAPRGWSRAMRSGSR